ncbi:superoxide dismutase family protein [Aureimonas sp. AU20]|uniref:superoxide dismutase family protein n=1 Tax=Aureimonas sp. AU20 TaxID=1349819 RepID=UPI000721F732|nr:superoxide dismutase family protein [Aureimonas sp. AU20]ALN72780.1 hypothetical protein M673_08630 [Aureimonas sp. AU20]
MKSVLLTVAALMMAAPLPALAQSAAPATAEPVGVTLRSPDGTSHGTIRITETPNGVLLDGDLTGLADGEYGFHFHEKGLCEGNFDSAGGHHNPTGKKHGFETEGGPHPGDMANIYVKDGVARFQQFNPMVHLASGDAPLNDADGTSIMVHGSPDDHHSQPSGNAGARMACGVVFAAP